MLTALILRDLGITRTQFNIGKGMSKTARPLAVEEAAFESAGKDGLTIYNDAQKGDLGDSPGGEVAI